MWELHPPRRCIIPLPTIGHSCPVCACRVYNYCNFRPIYTCVQTCEPYHGRTILTISCQFYHFKSMFLSMLMLIGDSVYTTHDINYSRRVILRLYLTPGMTRRRGTHRYQSKSFLDFL